MAKNRKGYSMKRIGQLVTSKEKLETRKLVTSYEVRTRALGIADGLTSTTAPNDMTAWYCKAYRVLGENKYAALASMARAPEVRDGKRMFGYLLKQELSTKNP